MRLRIDNFAKIKDADIIVDGITVIAGENNTGKSTIGKILYAMFNSLYNLNFKIEKRKRDEIYNIYDNYIQNLSFDEKIYFKNIRRLGSKFVNKLTKEILEMDSNSFDLETYEDKVYQFFKKNEINCAKQEHDEFIHNTFEKISYRKQNDNYKIGQELIQRYFLRTFGSQIQCLKDLDNSANVCLTIKGKDISICFQDNKCVEWQAEYNVLHEAFLLDDPFVLDNLSDYPFTTRGISADLERKIIDAENDIMEGLFEAIVAKENLKDIYNVLNKVIEGDILLQYGEGELKVDQFKEPLSFENLSAGLKSFVLIKILLEKGILKEKDVLILDEPEIHLHPEWQLYYAEIIVLLQRKFDLSIVVTTHSMNFLEAIELYAKKHDLISKCKFYKTNMENGLAIFEDVTDALDKIYRQMVTPSMLLDKLRYEMEEDNE